MMKKFVAGCFAIGVLVAAQAAAAADLSTGAAVQGAAGGSDAGL